MTIENLLRIHGHDTTTRELPDGTLVFDPKDPPMPDTCSCSPGACHGGHTIDVGPPWVCIPEERLRQFRDDEYVCVTDDVRSMAAELLALRARVSSWSDRLQELTAHGAELDRRGRELEAAQREPIGYGVVVEGAEGVGGLWVQTSPLLRESDAIDRAKFYAHQGARAVAMTEVGER